MDTLRNRKKSREAKKDNNGEQVPTTVTKDVKNGDNDKTVYATSASFHDQLKASADIDVKVATDDAERKQAERISAAIHAPGKTSKQAETAELDSQTAANSKNAEETAQQQANQTGTGADMTSQTAGATGGNGGGTNSGWTGGGAAVNGNAGAPPTPGTKSDAKTTKKA